MSNVLHFKYIQTYNHCEVYKYEIYLFKGKKKIFMQLNALILYD